MQLQRGKAPNNNPLNEEIYCIHDSLGICLVTCCRSRHWFGLKGVMRYIVLAWTGTGCKVYKVSMMPQSPFQVFLVESCDFEHLESSHYISLSMKSQQHQASQESTEKWIDTSCIPSMADNSIQNLFGKLHCTYPHMGAENIIIIFPALNVRDWPGVLCLHLNLELHSCTKPRRIDCHSKWNY